MHFLKCFKNVIENLIPLNSDQNFRKMDKYLKHRPMFMLIKKKVSEL